MADLADVRWIGGGCVAGKSTVAVLLGARHGVPVVRTDLSLPAHAAVARTRPLVDAFLRMSMDERWVDRGPEEMLQSFPWFAGEAFDLLLAELAELPDGLVLIEGFRLLPRLVAPLLRTGGEAVWLLPTPGRRARVFADRAADGGVFWQRTSDPERALSNVLERDRLFTERVRAEAADLGLRVIDVDGSEGPDAVAARTAGLLGLRGRRTATRSGDPDTVRGHG